MQNKNGFEKVSGSGVYNLNKAFFEYGVTARLLQEIGDGIENYIATVDYLADKTVDYIWRVRLKIRDVDGIILLLFPQQWNQIRDSPPKHVTVYKKGKIEDFEIEEVLTTFYERLSKQDIHFTGKEGCNEGMAAEAD